MTERLKSFGREDVVVVVVVVVVYCREDVAKAAFLEICTRQESSLTFQRLEENCKNFPIPAV